MRESAFRHVRQLSALYRPIPTARLRDGFRLNGERVPLINPQRGIFKPKVMPFLLSIRTVYPRPGGRVWYDDQRQVHEQIYGEHEAIDYAFMGNDPGSADNRWLKEAWEHQIPIIYFLGVAPGLYEACIPTFVSDWDARSLKARIVFGIEDGIDGAVPDTAPKRRYGLRMVKQRLHQAQFREAVITAYDGRCALSRMPEHRLLDAAHIINDAHEALGQPVVSNGLPLSKIHHAAFDSHLIGIDPDYRLHVSEQLLAQDDGPILEALKGLNGQTIHLPRRPQDRPDRDRLAARFETFRLVG